MSQAEVTISHIGFCVSDIQRSARFYEALGFVLEHYVDIGPPFERMTELPGTDGRAGFFRRGDVTIELASYQSPGVVGPSERRAMNQLGLTHLSLIVADLDAVAGLIAEHGGRVLSHTRVESPMGPMIFCTDPDGIRLELWQKAG
jgi:catechol 2,3-dioxygenase-like lactoylglutathione lyase family enzyme